MSKGGLVKSILGKIKAPWAVSSRYDQQGSANRGDRVGAVPGDIASLLGLALPERVHSLSSQITGPLSSPEYLSHLPKAGEYRALAPGYVRARLSWWTVGGTEPGQKEGNA